MIPSDHFTGAGKQINLRKGVIQIFVVSAHQIKNT